MQFSELTLEKVVLEVRYDNAFAFWDNSWKAMAMITGKFPKLELVNAQLSNVQSTWWAEGIVSNFSYVKADVTQDYSASLNIFKALSSVICDAVR